MELSLKDKKYLNNIINKYETKQISDIDRLKQLDKKVSTNPKVFAYIIGSIFCLIFGFGMCVAMKQILDMVWLGIVVGVIGMFLMIINYPIYKSAINKNKQKYADEIIRLSNQLLNE